MSVTKSREGAEELQKIISKKVGNFSYLASLFFTAFLIFFVLIMASVYDVKYARNTIMIAVTEYFIVSKAPSKKLRYYNLSSGKMIKDSALNISKSLALQPLKKYALIRLFIALPIAIFLSVFFVYFWLRFTKKFKKKDKVKLVRGGRILSLENYNKEINEKQQKGLFSIGGANLRKNVEHQHIFVNGDTGSGKGTAIKELLDQICELDDKFIVYDKSGEYIKKFYREGTDVILNPFDVRMPYWSVWNEIEKAYDFDHLAASFIPRYSGSSDPHWVDAPRTLFADLLRVLKDRNEINHLSLLEAVSDPKMLDELLAGSITSVVIDESSPEHANSVKAILIPLIKSLRYTPDDREELFSIKRWASDDTDKRRIFIYVDNEMKESVQKLVSVWMDIAISASLSLEDSYARRLWCICDEMASMGKLESVEEGVIEGRKKGLCMVLSVMNIALFQQLYGEKVAKTLASSCGTKISFRNDEPGNGRWLSTLYLEEDVKDTRESQTTMQDNKKSTSKGDDRKTRPLILPSEFALLNDKEAFFKTSGNYPVTKIYTPHIDEQRPNIAQVFMYQDPMENNKKPKIKAAAIQNKGEEPKLAVKNKTTVKNKGNYNKPI